MSKPKNCGKDQTRVFLDVFSLPENESGVHFPEKNLDPPLKFLSCFAVQYCTSTSIMPVFVDPQSLLSTSFTDYGRSYYFTAFCYPPIYDRRCCYLSPSLSFYLLFFSLERYHIFT